MTGLNLITDAASEPLDVDTEVKPHLRLETAFTDEDAMLAALVTVARQKLENETNRAFLTQTWDLILDRFPCGSRKNPRGDIYIPRGDLLAINANEFKYVDDSGAANVIDSAIYDVDTDMKPGRVFLKTGQAWPAAVLYPASAVRLRFDCGFGADVEDVPWAIKQAILLTIGHYYENRENTVISEKVSVGSIEIPEGASALVGPYRVFPYPNE